VRTSFSATVPWSDRVSRCIAERARVFQGFTPFERLEMLQVVRYENGQEYGVHFDWSGLNDRETSIFGVLKADCEHCGTQFPSLAVDWSTEDQR
jgi:prolyl 4-hydroxylase